MSARKRISVIVPVRNSAPELRLCLEALRRECSPEDEIIVVDDGSTDNTPDEAASGGAEVMRLERCSGPAVARNHGAKRASGEILFFVDADVVLGEGSIERVARTFAKHADIAALFGSYDSSPAAGGTVSQYRNLLHHYTHQTGCSEASTFWSGCGAIRAEVFRSLEGFDGSRYATPSIEDIELGIRLKRAGYRILLDPGLQAKHLKRWTLSSVIRTDITKRAIPWTQLILEDGMAPDDLNLKRSQRLCGLMAILIAFTLPLAMYRVHLVLVPVAALATVVFVNRDLYLFFVKARGFAFAIASVALHLLYYVYSSLSYAYTVAGWKRSIRRRSTTVSTARPSER